MVVSNGKQFLLMVATCDERAKIWVPLDVVRCRDVWAPGWLQREALKKLIAERVEGSACGECGGKMYLATMHCNQASHRYNSLASGPSLPQTVMTSRSLRSRSRTSPHMKLTEEGSRHESARIWSAESDINAALAYVLLKF
eukprot:jgi/Picsp_1/823/NSC_04312-R1_hypothetical protein CHLNCDRAFT_144126 [Chlorella variabilis]